MLFFGLVRSSLQIKIESNKFCFSISSFYNAIMDYPLTTFFWVGQKVTNVQFGGANDEVWTGPGHTTMILIPWQLTYLAIHTILASVSDWRVLASLKRDRHFFVTTLSLMILGHCFNIVAALEWIQNIGTTFDSDPTGESWEEQMSEWNGGSSHW